MMGKYKHNNNFKYSIQIPNFFSSEKCDEIIKQVTETEEQVVGCVGDEKGSVIIPEIRQTKEWYLTDQPLNDMRPDKTTNDWTWIQKKMYTLIQIVNKDTKEWYTMEKKKGSLTIFPTFLSHNVTPVTKGKRYVIQELFVGDHFR